MTAPVQRRRRVGGIVVVVAMVVVTLAALYVVLPREPLLQLSLGEMPAHGELVIEEPTEVDVWAEIDMRHAGIESRKRLRTLPHVMDYVIAIQGEGVDEELRCNPFNVSYLSSQSQRPQSRRFDAPIDGCRIRLGAGRYTVAAKRIVYPERAEGFDLDTTDALLRAR